MKDILSVQIRLIHFVMFFYFLVIGIIPIFEVSVPFVSLFGNPWWIYITELIILFCAIAGIIGIILLEKRLHFFATIIIIIGLLLSEFSTDYYLLCFFTIITWLFFEMRTVLSDYLQFVKEYKDYSPTSVEKTNLVRIFRSHLQALMEKAWIALILSWLTILSFQIVFVTIGYYATVSLSVIGLGLTIIYLIKTYNRSSTEDQSIKLL